MGTCSGLEKIRRTGNRHIFYRCGNGILLIFNGVETLKPLPPGLLMSRGTDDRSRARLLPSDRQ